MEGGEEEQGYVNPMPRPQDVAGSPSAGNASAGISPLVTANAGPGAAQEKAIPNAIVAGSPLDRFTKAYKPIT
jgi:hypothetical protein